MTQTTPLPVRIAELRRQLESAKQASGRLAAIDERLRGRVAGRLRDLTEDCERALAAIEGNGDVGAWKELRAVQKLARELSRESLAFTVGALLRQNEVDDRICELADRLLEHLNESGRLNWRGFTVPAETSFYGEVGQVIRLRFPELTLWHLPVAAHEFGHFANPTIAERVRDGSYHGVRYPVEDFLRAERERGGEKAWFHAHEYMADIFAAYALGPAYAYSSLVLRADPWSLWSWTAQHPSWDERFYVIVASLRELEQGGGATAAVVDDIEERWRATRAARGEPKELDEAKPRGVFDFFYPVLAENLRGVRHSTFRRAQQLAPVLADAGRPLDDLDEVTIPDVLNATWLARVGALDDERRAEVVAERAREACELL